jgi:hypothetical protein
MIKPEQVPEEAMEALIATLYGKPGLPYREALAAALNAWKGMTTGPNVYHRQDAVLHLPLPTEARDD